MTNSRSARSTTFAARSRPGGCASFAGSAPRSRRNCSARWKSRGPQGGSRFREAEAEADALVGFLRGSGRVVVAGSYRRRRDTVGDLDVLVTAKNGAAVGDRLVRYENVAEVVAHGPTRTTVMLRSGLQVDVRAVPEQSYGAALLYFTGSKAHNIALRGLANQHGWKLNEYGLFSGKRRIAGATEEDVYEKLGLAFIAPELREDRGEIAAARRPANCRSWCGLPIFEATFTFTPTGPTARLPSPAWPRRRRRAATSISRSPTTAVASPWPMVSIRRGWRARSHEIDRLNEKLENFTILKGIEVDILKDGSLDLPDSSLAKLDIVVAAVHSHFDLPRQAQTDRVVRALENRHVSILAHPTGRLIGEREPYDIDMDRVISAARHGRVLSRDQCAAGSSGSERSSCPCGEGRRRQAGDLDGRTFHRRIRSACASASIRRAAPGSPPAMSSTPDRWPNCASC